MILQLESSIRRRLQSELDILGFLWFFLRNLAENGSFCAGSPMAEEEIEAYAFQDIVEK